MVFRMSLTFSMASLVAQTVKNRPTMQETGLDPWVRKIVWRREWQSISVFLPGKSHGQRSMVGYTELETDEVTDDEQ